MDLDIFPNGLAAGSLYALVAVGFNILYRPTNVFNFAQGDLVMLGAMISASAMAAGLPWFAALIAAAIIVGIIGVAENFVAVAPVIRRSSVSHAWIISTLAYSLIIDNLVGHIWGPDPIRVDPPWPLSVQTFIVGGMRTSSYQIALIVMTALMILLIEQFYRTRAGKAVRAVAEDRDAALLRGINPDRLSQWSFFLGAGFAAMTGLLAAPTMYASTQLGPSLLVKGFEAAAVGGIGNNRGALMAGWLLGLAEAFGGSMLSPGYQAASTFALLLIVLCIQPRGLFGQPEMRSV
jgi:branched-chain amino acid transport system permease protein